MIDAPIDHVAIVVKDLDAALRLYTQTLGFSVVYRETVADQGVEAVGLRSGDAVIELLRPLSEDEAVGLYHASPRDPIWEYVLSPLQAELCFDVQSGRVCLIGHSHVQRRPGRRVETPRSWTSRPENGS